MDEPLLQVTQIRSLIGAKRDQRATVASLGLRRIRHTVTQPDRPEIRGMLAAVAHLVEVRYLDADEVLALEPGQQPKGRGRRAAGASVADDAVEELRDAEADALSVPGHAEAGAAVLRAPDLASTAPVDRPDPVSDATLDEPSTGVASASHAELPGAVTADSEPEVGAPTRTEADVLADDAAQDLDSGDADEEQKDQS